MSSTQNPRRSPLQRAVAARYDAWHALLVRALHPLCFAAFALVAGVLAAGIGYLALEIGDGDVAGYAFMAVVVLLGAIATAFTFVLTRTRVWVALAMLAGWSVALTLIDDIEPIVIQALWGVAALSVALQLTLLLWVVKRRFQAGLLHLMWPSLVGTLVGAVPVAFGMRALLDGDQEQAEQIATLAFIGGAVVLFVLLALHEYSRLGESKVMRAFALRHSLSKRTTKLDEEPLPLTAPLIGAWASTTGVFAGKVDGRKTAVASGFSRSRAPDVPSLHLVVLAFELRSSGRDLWVRRRDWTHDNVLAMTGNAGVVRFESIALDERVSIRFAPGTSDLDAFRTMGPQALTLLEAAHDGAQFARRGNVMLAWIVGGALDPDELDDLLATALAFGTMLEEADAAEAREARLDEPTNAPAGGT